ncbi:MAG: UDP-glucose dehydrogenase family protein [Pseudomonadota bacterium]
MKITVFGSGYVGLVTGACLADVGHEVLCVDVDARKVEMLRRAEVPIYEPGLSELVKGCLAQKTLAFTTSAQEGVAHGELIFIAVGTPPDEDGSSDLKYVFAVARSIAEHMSDTKIVIDKSTVPVGTAEKVAGVIAEGLAKRGVKIPYHVCSNPEFLKEGSAIEDFTRAARIVIGTDSEDVRNAMRQCYAPYNRNHDKLIFMGVRAAELTKYAANAMLATKISFMNEMAQLAERLGVDIEQVRIGIGSDPRIGFHFIYPGCGYGGSCFPKDIKALQHIATTSGYTPRMLTAVEGVNETQKGSLFAKLSHALGGSVKGKTIAVWGLAFKPNTDDMREAPSRVLLEAVWAAGGKVRAYDPKAAEETHRIYGDRPDLLLCGQRDEALQGADALVICTEWKAFRSVNFGWLKSQLKQPVVVDGRNLFDPEDVAKSGIRYYAVGRGQTVFGA